MDRVNGYDFVDIGGGRRGFRSQNKAAGISGTEVTSVWLNDVQENLMTLLTTTGITPVAGNWNQVLLAIQALIEAATGGGETSNYVLMSQARAQLRFFPEITNGGGVIPVSSPSAGTILIPTGSNFQHRGIYPVATSSYPIEDRTLATAASRTYHCRWSFGGGFALKDLADPTYNPGGLAESHASFDSSFDDMLIARIVTDAANAATITTLLNQDRLAITSMIQGVDPVSAGGGNANFRIQRTFNWGRRPRNYLLALANNGDPEGDVDFNIVLPGVDRNASLVPLAPGMQVDRYGLDSVVLNDGSNSLWMQFTAAA